MNGGDCRKWYETYQKQGLIIGLMAFWCTHGICVGYHFMKKAEGRNDVFSASFCVSRVRLMGKLLVLIREKEETLGMARGGMFRAAAKVG